MTRNLAEEAGIEPTKAFSAYIGFEDQEGHQTPSHSMVAMLDHSTCNFLDLHHFTHLLTFRNLMLQLSLYVLRITY